MEDEELDEDLYGADTKAEDDESDDGVDEDSESDIEIVLDNAPAAEDKPKEAAKPLIGLPIPKLDSTGVSAPVKSGIDIEAMGQYEGVDIINVDLDGFEDKPWRKPGADITDYFNFGFNEQSWRAYCTKQKLFRDELQSRAAREQPDVDFDYDLQTHDQTREQDFGSSKYQRNAPSDRRKRHRDGSVDRGSETSKSHRDGSSNFHSSRSAKIGSRDRSRERDRSRDRGRDRDKKKDRDSRRSDKRDDDIDDRRDRDREKVSSSSRRRRDRS